MSAFRPGCAWHALACGGCPWIPQPSHCQAWNGAQGDDGCSRVSTFCCWRMCFASEVQIENDSRLAGFVVSGPEHACALGIISVCSDLHFICLCHLSLPNSCLTLAAWPDHQSLRILLQQKSRVACVCGPWAAQLRCSAWFFSKQLARSMHIRKEKKSTNYNVGSRALHTQQRKTGLFGPKHRECPPLNAARKSIPGRTWPGYMPPSERALRQEFVEAVVLASVKPQRQVNAAPSGSLRWKTG